MARKAKKLVSSILGSRGAEDKRFLERSFSLLLRETAAQLIELRPLGLKICDRGHPGQEVHDEVVQRNALGLGLPGQLSVKRFREA